MLKSMTAYGRASVNTRMGHFVIEISSVNRKFLEINVFLPTELNRFENDLKKMLLHHATRGQITVKVTASFEEIVPVHIKVNMPLARQLKDAWQTILQDLHIADVSSAALLLSQQNKLFYFEDNQQEDVNYLSVLEDALTLALQGFVRMRDQEGAVLQSDILNRLKVIDQCLHVIKHKMPGATKRYREKLIGRLEEIMPGKIEHEERILREIAIFAEKIDITEEITRFACHLAHFEQTMYSNESAVGKTLEFIVQELNREATTIGNKSSDLDIARSVIEIKSELDRIREQLQNVE